MTLLHILHTPGSHTDWQRTTTRVRWLRGCTVITECCACRMPARETKIRFFVVDPKSHFAPYYGPTPYIRCAQGFGCTVAPWKRSGKAGREEFINGLFDGPPPFRRVRDGALLEFAD